MALVAAGVIGLLALIAAFLLRIEFGFFATAYVALLSFYSGPLKHVVIIDVLTIAIGFVLRAAAGAVAHAAYHLGAIRQIDKQTRGPREGTF